MELCLPKERKHPLHAHKKICTVKLNPFSEPGREVRLFCIVVAFIQARACGVGVFLHLEISATSMRLSVKQCNCLAMVNLL